MCVWCERERERVCVRGHVGKLRHLLVDMLNYISVCVCVCVCVRVCVCVSERCVCV